MKQVPPHAQKSYCDFLFEKNKIYGCGKPFQIVEIMYEEKMYYKAVECDYI